MLSEYAEKEFKDQPHIGETPVTVINDVIAEGKEVAQVLNDVYGVVKENTEAIRLCRWLIPAEALLPIIRGHQLTNWRRSHAVST